MLLQVRDRMERQGVQVRKLEANHAHLISRNNFRVLIFQVSVGQYRWAESKKHAGKCSKDLRSSLSRGFSLSPYVVMSCCRNRAGKKGQEGLWSHGLVVMVTQSGK